MNDSGVSKDCDLGLAGFPKDHPTRHRSRRFPFSDLFAVSPSARLDYHLVHTVILSPLSQRKQSRSFPQHWLFNSSLFCSVSFKQ